MFGCSVHLKRAISRTELHFFSIIKHILLLILQNILLMMPEEEAA